MCFAGDQAQNLHLLLDKLCHWVKSLAQDKSWDLLFSTFPSSYKPTKTQNKETKTGPHYVARAGSNSRSPSLSFLGTVITGIHHDIWSSKNVHSNPPLSHDLNITGGSISIVSLQRRSYSDTMKDQSTLFSNVTEADVGLAVIHHQYISETHLLHGANVNHAVWTVLFRDITII